MSIGADQIFSKILEAAQNEFKGEWDVVKDYAPAEFKKMAQQLESIAANVAKYELDQTQGYSPETGKLLFQMQKTACESVFVAITQLTLLAVQKAINAILDVLKKEFGGALALVL